MVLAGGTARSSFLSALLVAAILTPCAASAQVSARDRGDVLRQAQSRGLAEADVAPLIDEVDRAGARGLPQTILLNKVREGIAKGYPPARVHEAVRTLVGYLDTAREMIGSVPDDAMRVRAAVTLAEALSRGITRAEFVELRRLAEDGGPPRAAEGLAHGARFWALLKEAGFTPRDALPLVAETVRQDFRASEVTALAREMVARREDLATPARLEALREAVRRGDRAERLLPPRDAQGAVERPRQERPAPTRPERERPPSRER
jgi:hypothetical protein